jgi:hypothetical protein
MKGRLKGELRIVAITTQELQPVAEDGADYVTKDLLSLVEWAEREYNNTISI